MNGAQPNCFVIMGFGQKTDLATGRVLDLDKSYKNIIKPAVTAAGYNCVRADEIQHSGVIDVPMYEMLFGADLVVADLSTSNLNAIFELGVRHALKPRATVIMAENKFAIPFDASHIVVRHYEHLGPDIGFDEVMRMRDELTKLATTLKTSSDIDSPVYVALPKLEKPALAAAATAAASAAARPAPQMASEDSYASKLETVRDAMDTGAFEFAQKILLGIYKQQTAPLSGGDPTPRRPPPGIIQQLALATYKAGEAKAKTGGVDLALAGYAEAEALLRELDVDTTTDPETLGLWSAIHKRRGEIATRSPDEQKQDLDEAIRAAERGFFIKRDYYNGTNLAYLLTVRASKSSGDDRIADKVFADRVRRAVVDITEKRLQALQEKRSAEGDTTLRDEKYWIAASHAESLVALGDPKGEDLLREALASAPAGWMADTTKAQLDRVKSLLAGLR
ncbi:MAG TPA: tetratricopeptide repeat-containing protein [Roseiarcus sp.]|nr:tetratricopeptide repeat-containing protein [Roseiarcus sp.]